MATVNAFPAWRSVGAGPAVPFARCGPASLGRRLSMTTRPWLRNLSAAPTPRTIRKAPHRFRPAVEALEDRLVPATLTVTEAGDNTIADNVLTLREAILLVNSGGNTSALGRPLTFGEASRINVSTPFGTNDTILLPPGGPNQGLVINSALPDLSRSVKIQGPGAANLVVAAAVAFNPAYRVFQVDAGATVTISDVGLLATRPSAPL